MLLKRNHWARTPNSGQTALKNFPTNAFLLCMATGILAVNLRVLPYQFNGLEIIADVVWILDIILFSLIGAAFFSRVAIFPKYTWQTIEEEADNTLYLSTVAVSLSTIIELVALILGSTWSGWDIAALVFWYCELTSFRF